MGNRRSVRIRRRRRRPDDNSDTDEGTVANNRQSQLLGPLYDTGPVHELPARANGMVDDEQEPAARGKGAEAATTDQEESPQPAGHSVALPPITTHDSRSDQRTVVYGASIRLRGRTDSGDFNYASSTENITAVRATGCRNCDGDCLRVRGTLVATYTVNPTVTLPSVNDYPNLTPCQRRRVQNAIDSVLAPHEQRHVDAFRTYAGTTRRNIDLTICRSAWNEAAIDAMVQPEQAARQAAAIAASNALDPFFFDVDLDCSEAPAQTPRRQSTGDQPESEQTEQPVSAHTPAGEEMPGGVA